MRHRVPQQLVTSGLVSACPLAMVTRGLQTQRGVVRVDEVTRRHGTATTPTYVAVVELPLAARPSTYADGDWIETYDIGLVAS